MDRLPTAEISRTQVELLKLSKVLERYNLQDKFTIREVRQAGYIVTRKQPPVTGVSPEGKTLVDFAKAPKAEVPSVLALFDYDDTVYATTDAFSQRNREFVSYLKERGCHLSEAQTKRLNDGISHQSKWEDIAGTGIIDHNFYELAAWEWVLRALEGKQPDDRYIDRLMNRLWRIKAQLNGPNTQSDQTASGSDAPGDPPLPPDPFHFDAEKRRLVLNGIQNRWSPRLEKINRDAFIRTFLIDTVAESMKLINARFESAIFTKGDPTVQLIKVIGGISGGGDMPVNTIFLTKVPKGEYIKQLKEQSGTLAPSSDTVKRALENHGVMLLMDNNPDDLNSFISLTDKAGMPRCVGVRYRLRDAFCGDKDWEVVHPHGEVDTKEPSTTERVVAVLESCIAHASATPVYYGSAAAPA